MNHRLLRAGMTALGLLLAVPAVAEPMRLAQSRPAVLPPYEILTILRSTGFEPIGQPTRRGPNYVLRAVDPDGEEVRLVVDARQGEIVSVTPTVTASRMPPAPPGAIYVEPEPLPRGYRADPPPVVYDDEDEPPVIYAPPRRAPRYSSAAPDLDPLADPPPLIMAPEGSDSGLLPPPPGRFQQRATTPAQNAKPAPAKKRAAANPPLPKPRPSASPDAAPQADAAPLPPPMPENKPGEAIAN